MQGIGSGTSSGTSNQTTTSPYAKVLEKFGLQQEKMAQPLLSMASSQMLEALRTGGINAFIPMISRALDSSRQAGSTGIEQLRQQLARGGFGGTLGGQSAIAGAEQQAGEQVAATPSALIQQWISQAPGFGQQLASMGGNQILGAANFNQTSTGKTTSTPSFWDLFFRGLSAGGQAVGGAGLAAGA